MKREKVLETILVILVGLLILFFIFGGKLFLAIAALVGLIGLLSGRLAEKIATYWLKFSEILGRFISKIILALVFFVFLTPIAILSRIFSKSNLRLKRISGKSYFTERNYEYGPSDMEKPW